MKTINKPLLTCGLTVLLIASSTTGFSQSKHSFFNKSFKKQNSAIEVNWFWRVKCSRSTTGLKVSPKIKRPEFDQTSSRLTIGVMICPFKINNNKL